MAFPFLGLILLHLHACPSFGAHYSLGLYHGKSGYGISVEFNVKLGPVTIFSCTQTRAGELKFLVAEGESIPGPILRIGNTNSRIRFGMGPAEFVDAWCAQAPTHHCALGVGHLAPVLQKFARLEGLTFGQVAQSLNG